MTVDVLFLAWNRLEYTRFSFEQLLANTDWEQVRQLVVYDDGSEDGTREWLDQAVRDAPVPTILRAERCGSPTRIMAMYVHGPDPAAIFAKVDNDIVMPAGWLSEALTVLDDNPSLELLGIEAGMTARPTSAPRGFTPSTHIGGVGLMRTSAFQAKPRMQPDGRNGFTEWQHTHQPIRGWITPDLPAPALDRMPIEPWRSLAFEYEARGWQRPWGVYDQRWMSWAWEWWPTEVAA